MRENFQFPVQSSQFSVDNRAMAFFPGWQNKPPPPTNPGLRRLAGEMRKRLDRIKDPAVLAITGYDLAMDNLNDYGMVELGRSYLRKADWL
jgi:hypothetical protein